jgi:hypothetical protein
MLGLQVAAGSWRKAAPRGGVRRFNVLSSHAFRFEGEPGEDLRAAIQALSLECVAQLGAMPENKENRNAGIHIIDSDALELPGLARRKRRRCFPL